MYMFNKKLNCMLLLIAILTLLTGCGKEVDMITFNATIDEINENRILVSTSDDVGFDLASVDFDESMDLDFNLLVGQEVIITILSEIRESYPVQVTAVDIKLVVK